MNKNVLRQFNLAKRASIGALHEQFKIGALITVKNVPIGCGFNDQIKTHPLMKRYDPHKTIHAELSAILKVKDKSLLNGATMTVFRETKDGVFANSRPCEACQKILKKYGFSEMIYTIENGWKKESL